MIKNFLLICCGAIAVYIPQYLYRLFQSIKKNTIGSEITEDENNSINVININESKMTYMYDVMFFTRKSSLCRVHLYKDIYSDIITCKRKHCPVKYLRKIKDYLGSATDSLYVCVFIITCTYLREAIIEARARGVTVKVITDIGALMNTNTKVSLYELEGIEVRYLQQNDEILMHHKFVIIDDRYLITGSTNWTMTAFFGNFENIIVTNNAEVIDKYRQEFIKIWDELCDPFHNINRRRGQSKIWNT